MAIEFNASDSLKVQTAANSVSSSNTSGEPSRLSSTFGEVLNGQSALLKIEDGKQSVNVAKLLSPNITHANQLLNKTKTYSDLVEKSIDTFETNIHKSDSKNLVKNSLDNRLVNSNIALAVVAQKISTNMSGGFIANSPHLPLNVQALNITHAISYTQQKVEHTIAQSPKAADEEMDDAGLLKYADGSGEGDFFKDSPTHQQSQDHADQTMEQGADEISALGALINNLHSIPPADLPISESSIVQMQIQSSISSAEWIPELAQKVVVMFGSDKHTAVITLNSTEQGSLKIVIHVSGDQVNATFYSDDSDVMQALHEGLDRLRSSMLHAGVQLGIVDIGPNVKYHHLEMSPELIQSNPNFIAPELLGEDVHLDLANLNPSKIVNFYV